MGKLLDPEFTLPPLSNFAKQPVGSNACGCYVLHYMEQELKLFRGEWPSVWPEDGWKLWKLRLGTAVPKLQSEQKAMTEAAKLKHLSLQAEKTRIAEQKEKAQGHHLSILHDCSGSAEQELSEAHLEKHF